jgi:hypothetical protein
MQRFWQIVLFGSLSDCCGTKISPLDKEAAGNASHNNSLMKHKRKKTESNDVTVTKKPDLFPELNMQN